MREILFRGKRADNGEWVYGHYVKKRDPLLTSVEYHFIVTQDIGDNGLLLSFVSWNKVIPKTVGQYTGLTDKNGTKIFEGDILKNEEGSIYSGSYKNEVVLATGIFIANGLVEFMPNDFELCEVIGNIHDNPNFMEE